MPAPTLNVVMEIPESDQGETADKPMPAPNAISSRANAADATAPAATAAHDIADICASSAIICTSSDTMLGSEVCDRVCIAISPRGAKSLRGPCAPTPHNRCYISSPHQ